MSATAISTSPLLVDINDADEMEKVKLFLERLAERALRMDGTCTGEHGIGQGKIKYILAEHGPVTIGVMRAIKQTLDPQNIMNPGKMLPAG